MILIFNDAKNIVNVWNPDALLLNDRIQPDVLTPQHLGGVGRGRKVTTCLRLGRAKQQNSASKDK